MTEVNRENMRKWVDALRSGEYEQTTGALASRGRVGIESLCCLGVACVIAGAERTERDGEILFDGRGATLPDSVSAWLGVRGSNVRVEAQSPLGMDRRVSVSELNDGHGYTFDQIADAIEATYLA